MYQLFFDSDCDITLEWAKKYNAKLISMPYVVCDEEYFPYKSWEKFEAKQFYDTLRKGNANQSTSALSEQEYIDYFEPVLKEGKDILYVHFSREMSATFKSCDKAIEELLKKYPDRRIELIDTKGITICSFLTDIQIGELYLQGKSIDEIVEASKEIIPHSAAYFFADNLKFFARSGRVSGFSAFMGGMIGVKPVIHISNEGKMVSIDKAVGRKKVLEKIMDYVVKLEDHIKDYPIVIAHADAPYLVADFDKMLKERFGEDIKYILVDVNPTAGCHCGPDVLGIGFHAKER